MSHLHGVLKFTWTTRSLNIRWFLFTPETSKTFHMDPSISFPWLLSWFWQRWTLLSIFGITKWPTNCTFHVQIHWFSIFNSFMMVIFLTGLVSMILMRTLRNDYAKYAREDDDLESLVSSESEVWSTSVYLYIPLLRELIVFYFLHPLPINVQPLPLCHVVFLEVHKSWMFFLGNICSPFLQNS
jgi:hypothetical protein